MSDTNSSTIVRRESALAWRDSPARRVLEEVWSTGDVLAADGSTRRAFPTATPRQIAELLHTAVQVEDARSTLEVGMAYGLSTLALADAHAARGAGRHVALDPHQSAYWEAIGRANVERAGLSDRVRLVEDRSELALPRLFAEGLRLDLAFVDGLHLFDHCLIDFFWIDRMLDLGGIVIFDDMWMPAMQRVVEFVGTNRGYELIPHAAAAEHDVALLRKSAHDDRAWNHFAPF